MASFRRRCKRPEVRCPRRPEVGKDSYVRATVMNGPELLIPYPDTHNRRVS